MNDRSLASTLCLLFAGLAGCAAPVPLSDSAQMAFPKAYKMDLTEYRADGISKNRIAVGFNKAFDAEAIAAKYGVRVKSALPSLHTLILEVPSGTGTETLLAKVKKDANVAFAQPLRLVKAEKAVDDPRLKEQYALDLTQAAKAWDVTMGEKATVIALIDSGIDPDHPDLAGKVVAKYSAVTKDDNVRDGSGHGTHTAGIAAALADNGEGIAGMAPQCGLMIVKVLDDAGVGREEAIAEGITWAADHGAKVANMSFGLGKRSPLIEKALQYALDKDVVLVASAGNDERWNDPVTAPHIPSTYPGVLEVASTDKKDQHDIFANFGDTVFISAPGVNILSTMPTYPLERKGTLNYGVMSGTSMAAPQVAGVAGLIRSQHPDWDRKRVAEQLKKATVDLGQPGLDTYFGYGRVDALKAVTL